MEWNGLELSRKEKINMSHRLSCQKKAGATLISQVSCSSVTIAGFHCHATKK